MTEVVVAEQQEPAQLPAVAVPRFAPTADVFSDPEAFEHAQRVAKVFASSNLVPQHLKGQVADCLIAYQIARRLNEEPLTVFQNIYIVSGRPGWKTEYVIARANRSGVFKGRITWKASGKGGTLAVTAHAILAETGEVIDVTCDMDMARAEGWTKNAKYTSMPEHMLRWRSAAMLIRLYAPEVMLGMPIVEELETLPPRDVTPPKTLAGKLDALAALPSVTATSPALVTDQTVEQVSASEQTEQDQASQTLDAGPSPTAAEDATGGAEAEVSGPNNASAPPMTPDEYRTYCLTWLGELTSVEEIQARWTREKSMRVGLSAAATAELDAVKKQRVFELKKKTS
jgi:hypothetical protein